MTTQRFTFDADATTSVAVPSGVTPAFVPCPVALWGAYSAQQQAAIIQLYELALERTRAAQQPRRWGGLVRFSVN